MEDNMRRQHTAIATVLLIGTPAFAADMGVPPAPPAAPVYNWTGWYAGVNAGASFGNVKTDFNGAPSTFFATTGGTLPSLATTFTATAPAFGFSDTVSPDGFIGGGQIGYNWQFSPIWVPG